MNNSITNVLIRYFFLLILGAGNLFLFYLIVTPLTVYPTYWILSFFYDVSLQQGTYTAACGIAENILPFLKSLACMNTTILLDGFYASIIPACIAGSAYYLLLILNLSTPMQLKKRIKSIIFILSSFLILNIIRISFFALLFVKKGYELFDFAHLTSWYFGSTIFVLILWFGNVILFKINSIPIYTDIKMIINRIRGKE